MSSTGLPACVVSSTGLPTCVMSITGLPTCVSGGSGMIEIERAAWETMVGHAQKTFPNECCGAMLGRVDGERKMVTLAVPMENAYQGSQGSRYEIRPED